MKSKTRKIILCVWVFSATLVLAYIWINNPNYFFQPPSYFSNWLADFYSASNAEDIADLEIIFVFIVSFLIVFSFTNFLIRLVKKR